jgi:hypothetical protein
MAFSSDRALQSNQLPLSIDFPEEPTQLRETLETSYKRTVGAMNKKEGSLYPLQEVANFQQYFEYSDQTKFIPDPNDFRNGYRTTFDLIALNFKQFGSMTIPVGVTILTLSSTTTPPLINGILNPTRGYGGATIAGPIYVFINDPQLYVRFNNTVSTAQQIIITNNTGFVLTQVNWVIEFLKN